MYIDLSYTQLEKTKEALEWLCKEVCNDDSPLIPIYKEIITRIDRELNI